MICKMCKLDHDWTIEEALQRLEKGPAVIRKALSGAGPEELGWALPKAWSPKQVAVHLLDTEMVYGVRVRKILSEDNAIVPAYDQDCWAAACSDGRELGHVLDTFESLRRDNLAPFRASVARLDRTC